ncbi:MAG: hypothetical protein J5611_00790 [Alphaproteobacteria bacterium]|nr:hypothetical protein [Alphaproteobacteria bacterium]
MNKYILLLAGIFFCGAANASVMCSSSDYVTVVLDPYVQGTTYTYNAAAMTWTTVFPYGNVSGVAVCNDTSGSWGVASNAEQYETGGVQCWCKMTHPAVSRWVFRASHSSASDCADSCAARCGGYVQFYSAFRSGVFGSVAP